MNHDESDRIIKVETEVVGLRKSLDEVRGDVKEILVNHLPHLSNQIAALTVKVTLGAAIASLLASALAGWFFSR